MCRPPAEPPRQFENGVWLQGPDSLIVGNLTSQIPPTTSTFEMSFAFRTFTSGGMLIYLMDATSMHYVLVYFSEGRVFLNMSLTGLDLNHLNTTNTYNDGQWYAIGIVVEGSSITLTVGSEVKTVNAQFAATFDPREIVLIGSPFQTMAGEIITQLAAALGDGSSVLRYSIPGCFRSLRLNGVMVNISESAVVQQRVSLDGCPAEVRVCIR